MSLRSNTIESGAPRGAEIASAASPADDVSEVCRALGRVLRDGVDIHRCQAAQALGRIDDPAGVRPLVDALLDEDEDVRTDAAGGLARLAPPEAGRQLLENLLGDPCTGVKLSAIDALTRLRHPELVPWLRRLVAGRDEEIAWDESEFYEGGWDDWVDVQVKAIQALAELRVEEAVPEIVAAIDDEFGQDLTEVGFKALGKLGAPGIEALSRYLAEGDERQRRRVAAVLAACDGAAAQRVVTRALGDPSKDVRLAALRALAARDPSDPRLASLLSDPEPELRAEAVRLCGRHHADLLAALSGDDSPVVLGAVFEVLAERPDVLPKEAAAQTIRSALVGPDAGLSAGAALALAAVAPEQAAEDLVAQLGDPARPPEARLGAVRGLARLGGEQAVAALAAALDDGDREIRLKAMTGLAALAAVEEVWPNRPGDILFAALRGELVPAPAPTAMASEGVEAEDVSPASDERAAAESPFPTSTLASILGDQAPCAAELEDRGAPVELTQADMDRLALAARNTGRKAVPVVPQVAPHQDVRRFAARVLGDLTCDDVAGALAQALGEDDIELRRAAADSLARIGDHIGAFAREVTEVVIRALIDADRDVRLSAIRALGAAGGAGAARVLDPQIEDPDAFVRVEAVRALARLGQAGPRIEALLGDPDPGVRLAAAHALANAGGGRALDLLTDFAFAFEGYHRREASRLLQRLDPAAASARMVQVFDDRARVRFWPVAIEVLEEINRTDRPAVAGSLPDPGQQAMQQEGVGTS